MKRALTLLTAALGIATVAPAAQAQTTITFWTWYLSPKFDDYVKSTIAAFEKANPGIKVQWFDKQDSMVQDFIAAVNLGRAPDVINLNIDETQKAAQNGFLRAASDLSGRDYLTRTYYPQSITNFSYRGKTYGYPWYGWLNEGVLLYNPDLFKRAGLSRAPRSLSEMFTYARTVKDKTGAYGWVPAMKDPNTASFLGYFHAEGLPIYAADGKAAFNSAAHAALLQRFVDLYRGGYVPEDVVRREAFQLATELYAQNRLAMIIGGPQALTRLKDTNPGLYGKTVVTDAPLGRANVQTGGGMNLAVPVASKHPQQAARFAAFVTNNANQLAFAKVVPIVPTTLGSRSAAQFRTTSSDPIARATSLVGSSGRFINPGFRAPQNSDDLYKNFNDNIEAALLGKKSAQAALNDSVQFWNANMK